MVERINNDLTIGDLLVNSFNPRPLQPDERFQPYIILKPPECVAPGDAYSILPAGNPSLPSLRRHQHAFVQYLVNRPGL